MSLDDDLLIFEVQLEGNDVIVLGKTFMNQDGVLGDPSALFVEVIKLSESTVPTLSLVCSMIYPLGCIAPYRCLSLVRLADPVKLDLAIKNEKLI